MTTKSKFFNFFYNILIAFIKGFTHIFTWRGCASRFEFWSFWIVTYILGYGLGLINSHYSHRYVTSGCYFFGYICVFATISYAIRRFHDTNRSAGKFWFMWGTIFVCMGGLYHSLNKLINLVQDFLPLDFTELSRPDVASWDMYLYLFVPIFLFTNILFLFIRVVMILLTCSQPTTRYDNPSTNMDWIAFCMMLCLMAANPLSSMMNQVTSYGRFSPIDLFSMPLYENIVDLDGHQESVSGEELLNALSKQQ